jgi:hypothetical protein
LKYVERRLSFRPLGGSVTTCKWNKNKILDQFFKKILFENLKKLFFSSLQLFQQ